MSGEQQVPPAAVATRFHAPTYVRDLVDRRRLIERLRAGRDHRLTLIHAPAGYGKTTLAVQWLRVLDAEGTRIVWLGLHPDDNAPAWFLAHLLEAVRRTLPDAGHTIAELNVLLEQHSDEADRFILSALVNQIEGLDTDVAFVLDDWHLIEDARVVSALSFLLDFAPPNLRVIVTSRTRSSLPLAQLRVRDHLTEIDAELLRFDADEARVFLLEVNRLRLAPGDVDRLTEGTDGWVAALQLASLSLRGTSDPSGLIRGFSGRHHSIGEYLAENVLDALAPEVLDFLLATSVCDRLCGSLAAAVSGNPQGQAMLDELERRDLFLRPLDQEREWFRYHHLFADYLRRRLERDYPGRGRRLHATASTWFAEHALTSEAVAHSLAGGDQAKAVDLVEQRAMSLVEHSRMVTLLGLVDKLPSNAVSERPRLLMAVAWANCLLQRSLPAQQSLDRLRFALATTSLPDVEHGELLSEADVVQACIDIYADRIDRAEGLLRPALEHHETYRPWVIAVASNIQSFVDIHRFDFEAARVRQRWARPFHDRTTGPFAGVYGRCFAGIAAGAQLDLAIAEQHLHDAVALARDSAGPRSHAAQLAGALLGEVHYERGQLLRSEELLEDSRALGSESGVVDFMLATYGTLSRVKALRGDSAAALGLLAEGDEAAAALGLPRLRARVAAERVRLYLSLGRVGAARQAVEALPDSGSADGGIAVVTRQTRISALAAVAGADGDHATALRLLDDLLQEVSCQRRPRARLLAQVRLAAALQRAQRPEQAVRTLAPVLIRAATGGLVRTILDEGVEIVQLLNQIDGLARYDRWPTGLERVPPEYVARLLLLAGAPHAEPGLAGPAPSGDDPLALPAAVLRSLSAREIEILRLLDRGLSNKEIARDLNVTVNTVKWYLKSIFAKLGVSRRMESATVARRSGLLA